ncbi:MAG: alpha/beta hydrolase [Actinobacteria bacterium]|nr:alpha/beta hydrolase [Actinomycetota bacterium]MDA8185215.1 alpha/beta hydrolase [Actinomycetota bacterium]
MALHGWRRSHLDFEPALGPASAGGPMRALALDLPGFGASPAPPLPWGSADYASAVAAAAEETGAGKDAKVAVVGHSLGGRVAVALAAARPDLVGALVLTGAPLLPRPGGSPRPARSFRMLRALHKAGLLGEERMERARQRFGSADYRAAQGIMRQVLVKLLAERYGEWAASISCPVELVWGSEDVEAPLPVAEKLVELMPAATLRVLTGIGHLVPTEAPSELRQAVERAVAACLP